MHSSERLVYMDNLRALAMLAGVVFHAALAYSPLLHSIFPTADRQQSPWVDGLAWFLHLFRMPLFFLVAGFFAAMLVEKRGLGGMLAHRSKRVLLPFLLFWPPMYFLMQWLTTQAALNAVNPSPLLVFIKPFLSMENPPPVPPSTVHLWFLYYLMLFYLLCWCAQVLLPETLRVRLRALQFSNVVWALPLLLVLPLASVSAPHPAPESFLPQLWALATFGAFFALGYGLQKNPQWWQDLRAQALKLALLCALTYPLFFWLLQSRSEADLMKTASWPLALLQACLSVWLTLLALDAGRRFLTRSNAVLRYLADSSYWVYLLHLPVLFAIQYRLLDIDAHWALKFLISLLATLAICVLSYQVLVRRTLLGRFLNGPVARAAP